jgi:DNA-binding transcriptional ArsR family regulator
MLARLASSELTIGELAEPLSMSLAAASKHVLVLEKAGLIHRNVIGRRHVCRLEAGPLAAANEWLMKPVSEVRIERLISAPPSSVYRAWLA